MIPKNDGKIHDKFYNLNKEEKDVIATDFSEGSIELKKLLLSLWENNFSTHGCCAGHEETEKDSYISIKLNDNNYSFANYLTNILQSLSIEKSELVFSYNNNFLMSIYVNPQNRDKLFSIMTNLINNNLHVNDYFDKENELFLYAKTLNEFISSYNTNHDINLNFNLSNTLDKDTMFLSLHKENTIYVSRNNEYTSLDTINKYIKENGNLYLSKFTCDLSSLKEFMHILYPDRKEFEINNYKNKY